MLLSLQGSTAPLGVHAPAKQVAPGSKLPSLKQALSLQTAPLASSVWVQPAARSQPSLVHGLLSSQVVAAPGKHAPPLQVSPLVQALLSEHGAELAVCKQPLVGSQPSSVQGLPSLHAVALVVCWQPAAKSQLSSVQRLLSLHELATPPLQVPAAHVSALVQGLPSSHGAVFGVCRQPALGSQASPVHGLPSSHAVAAEARQTADLHVSPAVQALPSSQA